MTTRLAGRTGLKIDQLSLLATVVLAFTALAALVLTGQAGIREDLRALQAEMLAGQAELRAEMRAGQAELRKEMRDGQAELRKEMRDGQGAAGGSCARRCASGRPSSARIWRRSGCGSRSWSTARTRWNPEWRRRSRWRPNPARGSIVPDPDRGLR